MIECANCTLEMAEYAVERIGGLPMCPGCMQYVRNVVDRRVKGGYPDVPPKLERLVSHLAETKIAEAQGARAQAYETAAANEEARRDREKHRIKAVTAARPQFEEVYEEIAGPQPKPQNPQNLQKALPETEVDADGAKEAETLAQIKQELARRALCKRHLLPYVKNNVPKYEAGWVHKDVCRRLERFSKQVENRESPRLMLFMPPRAGKSELASKNFPAWHLGRNPTHDIIAASYSASLATGFSKKVRELIRGKDNKLIFPELDVDPNNQNAEGWSTNKGGMYVPAGVEGPITGRGAHCLPLSAEISTPEGPKTLGELIEGRQKEQFVLSYDGTQVIERRINAFITRQAPGIYRIQTSTGAFEATGEHPVCVGFCEKTARPQYRRVDDLRAGDQLVGVHREAALRHPAVGAVPDVRRDVLQAGEEQVPEHRHRWGAHLLEQVCLATTKFGEISTSGMRDLWRRVPRVVVRGQKEGTRGGNQPLLLERVLRGLSDGLYPWRGAPPVLAGGADLYPLREGVHPEQVCGRPDADGDPILQPGVLPAVADWVPYSTGYGDSWGEILPPRVQETADRDNGNGPGVCRVWPASQGPAPQGRGPREQRPAESGTSVSELSHQAPPARAYPVVESVTWVEGEVTVGDMEVADTRSYLLPSGISLRNCLILDDLVKNREEAESATRRQAVIDWYTSTAYTRLAPGGGILLILTRWHEADIAGHLLAEAEEGGEQWEVVSYPAIAVEDEPFRRKGEALHPERYDLKALGRIKRAIGRRDWQALYQQDPIGEEGDYFSGADLRYYSPMERPPLEEMTIYSAWDLAIGKNQQNDFTAGVVFGIDRQKNLWMLDLYHGKWGSLEIVDKLFEMYLKWEPQITGIERTHVEQAIGPFLTEQKRQRNLFAFRIEPLKHGNRDKVARAAAIRGLIEMNRVYLPKLAPWTDDVVNEILKFPNGKHDDICLVAGTQVSTPHGPMAIEGVAPGMRVTTPEGPRAVVDARPTGVRPTYRLTTTDGRTVEGTGSHPFYTANRGFVRLDALAWGDELVIEELPCLEQLSTAESPSDATPNPRAHHTAGTSRAMPWGEGGRSTSTGTSGSASEGLYLKDTTSTTAQTTRHASTPTSSSACHQKTTSRSTLPSGANAECPQNSSSTSTESALSPPSGTDPQRDSRGTQNMDGGHGRAGSQSERYAPSVEGSTTPTARIAHASAHLDAETGPMSGRTPVTGQSSTNQSLSHPHENASTAALNTSRPSEPSGVSALRHVGVARVELTGRNEVVYNLTVEDQHVYFANGLLTHNCDSMAWLGQMVQMFHIRTAPPKPKKKSWTDNLERYINSGGSRASHMSS